MELEDLLCDACLYKVENDPSTLVADMCARCREKVFVWLADTFDEIEGLEE
jgi:hypothetical protein